MADPWANSGNDDGGKRWYWIGGGIAVVVIAALLFVFLIKPAYTGYSVYSALKEKGTPDAYIKDVTSLSSDKAAAEAGKASAEAAAAQAKRLADDAQKNAADAQRQYASCTASLDSCKTDAAAAKKQSDDLVKSLGNDLGTLRADLQSCMQNITQAQESEAVIADAARRLCCVQRVENSAINSYNIDGGRIVCATDGKKSISC
jgi:hypothetical protein